MRNYLNVSVAVLIVTAMGTGPTFAQLSVDAGILDAEVDLDTDDGVNVGADVGVLGDDGANADADVSLGGDSAADASVDANVGGDGGADASVDANVGGDDGLVDADVDVGVGGGNGGGGDTGDSDDNGDNGGADNGGDGDAGGGGGVNPGASSGGSNTVRSSDNATVSCVDQNSPAYAQLANISYASGVVASWAGASAVAFIPVSICPGSGDLFASGLLEQVAASVPALQTSLAQSSYSASDIIGIVQDGGQLNVYVN